MYKYLLVLVLLVPFFAVAEFDVNDPADLLALKNEVNNDPLGLGYNSASGDTGLVITTINAKDAQFIVSKPFISPTAIRATCTYNAYNNLSIDEQEWIRWMTGSAGGGSETLEVTADLRLQLTDAEGNGNASIWAAGDRVIMNAAMLLLIDVDGSRAEDLFGFGTVISKTDWFAARDS